MCVTFFSNHSSFRGLYCTNDITCYKRIENRNKCIQNTCTCTCCIESPNVCQPSSSDRLHIDLCAVTNILRDFKNAYNKIFDFRNL